MKIEGILLIIAVAAFLLYLGVMAIKNHWISQLTETIETAIKEAEKSGKSGADKKLYVLEQVEKKCEELKIPYKLTFGLVSKLIDTIVKHYNVIVK